MTMLVMEVKETALCNVDGGLLRCGTEWTCRLVPMFWRNILASGLKKEPVCSSKMLVPTYKSVWHHNPEH